MGRQKMWNKTEIINNKKGSRYGMIIMIIRPLHHILKVTKIKCSSHNQCKYVMKSVDEITTLKKSNTLQF